jgi:hypothetical protein
MDSTDRETRPASRSMSVRVFGNSADEIELSALDEARPFFGEAARLEVARDWHAGDVGSYATLNEYRERATGKKYTASVLVRTIEPEGGQ